MSGILSRFCEVWRLAGRRRRWGRPDTSQGDVRADEGGRGAAVKGELPRVSLLFTEGLIGKDKLLRESCSKVSNLWNLSPRFYPDSSVLLSMDNRSYNMTNKNTRIMQVYEQIAKLSLI